VAAKGVTRSVPEEPESVAGRAAEREVAAVASEAAPRAVASEAAPRAAAAAEAAESAANKEAVSETAIREAAAVEEIAGAERAATVTVTVTVTAAAAEAVAGKATSEEGVATAATLARAGVVTIRAEARPVAALKIAATVASGATRGADATIAVGEPASEAAPWEKRPSGRSTAALRGEAALREAEAAALVLQLAQSAAAALVLQLAQSAAAARVGDTAGAEIHLHSRVAAPGTVRRAHTVAAEFSQHRTPGMLGDVCVYARVCVVRARKVGRRRCE
jgi:hypothetical protein